MNRYLLASLATSGLAITLAINAFARQPAPEASAAQSATPAASYEPDGRMRYPANYREWIYLSSGFDMSYSNAAHAAGDPSLFDNVFVDPKSYRAFVESGEWPDGTVLVLEVRNAQNRGSINKGGQYQSSLNHFEAHVKDSSRFKGNWAFFGFDGEKSGTEIPHKASCYSCHSDHAAVDTTFVQFYPTLLPVAEKHKKLSDAYRKELSALGNVSK